MTPSPNRKHGSPNVANNIRTFYHLPKNYQRDIAAFIIQKYLKRFMHRRKVLAKKAATRERLLRSESSRGANYRTVRRAIRPQKSSLKRS